jgi:predicted nucleic acid-binding protein
LFSTRDSGIIKFSIPDAIIAATTLQHGLTLVTFNPRDFDLPGLQLYPLDLLS